MKEIISYLYKIDIEVEYIYKNSLLFKNNNRVYLYKEVIDEDRINTLNKYVSDLNNYRFFCYKIKSNIYNKLVSTYQDKKFVLIEMDKDFEKYVDFEDMISFYNDSSNFLYSRIKYNNIWEVLWENKIDYLTNHFNNNLVSNKKYDLVFNYYITVAENALLYVINTKTKYKLTNHISFVHRRIDNPVTKFDFYNPLNFIVDLEIRDISEYIKSLYYSNEDYITELNFYLSTHKLDNYLASLLFARILYPSIFFDDYESNNIDINKYIRFDLYENFIKKIHDLILSYIYIDKIDWLN